MSAIACGADWVIVPESPPDFQTGDKWEEVMCDVIQKNKQAGKRSFVIIVAEGAIDKNGKPIKSEYIQSVYSISHCFLPLPSNVLLILLSSALY